MFQKGWFVDQGLFPERFAEHFFVDWSEKTACASQVNLRRTNDLAKQ